ncbi:MAG: GntR family transcriptional regulator [Rhabdochlamydiaceae bacterium]|nr:GntR family transcriptional regulator [Rhabdochlamydiaceae bacterium]
MESKTLVHQCFEHIREKIVRGEYLPGRKLAVVALAKEIEVGPTPVREALSRLTETGLVEAVENQGFKVSSLSEDELRDLYQTFYQIESLVLSQAIERGDDEWESQVVAALYQLGCVEDAPLTLERYPLWAERNARFHYALASGCGSSCLIRIRNQLFMQFDRYFQLAFRLDPSPIIIDHNDHKILAEAVLKRDKQQMIYLLNVQTKQGLDEMITKLKRNKIFV